MTIYYDSQIFLLQKYGGISRYFLELAKAINIQGKNRAYIIAGIYDNQYLSTEHYPFIKGMHSNRWIQKITKNRFYNLTAQAQKLAEYSGAFFLKKADLIHETYYSSVSHSNHKAPVITTIHDLIYEKYASQFADAKEIISAKKGSIERASHIIAISNNTKKDLIDCYNVSPDKVSVVYHGTSNLPVSGQHIDNNKPYILYVGRREGYKNFRLLLNVFAANKELHANYKLVCMGGGRATIDEESVIKESGISNRVAFTDGDDSVLGSLYANADVFVYPSIYEGWGLPPLEAMQLGCPVICAESSSIPEAVGDAAMLFNPLSADELNNSLVKLLGDAELREKYIRRGKEQVKKYTWEKTAEKTIEAYKKSLA